MGPALPFGGVMSYIERHLMDGERVVYATGPHPIVLLKPALKCLAGLAAGAWVTSRWGAAQGLAALGLAALWSLPGWVRHLSSECGVTNKRVFVKGGWANLQTVEVLLINVGVVTVDQGLWGRLLGFGTVSVTGSGGLEETLRRVRAPLEFRSRIYAQIMAVHEALEAIPDAPQLAA